MTVRGGNSRAFRCSFRVVMLLLFFTLVSVIPDRDSESRGAIDVRGGHFGAAGCGDPPGRDPALHKTSIHKRSKSGRESRTKGDRGAVLPCVTARSTVTRKKCVWALFLHSGFSLLLFPYRAILS